MALTRDFKDTVMKRAREDRAFREGLLTEAIECLLDGDLDSGKSLLRDYVNATVGFQALSKLMNKKDTSLKRMLGPKGNPAAGNLFAMTQVLQRHEGVTLKVVSERRGRATSD